MQFAVSGCFSTKTGLDSFAIFFQVSN